MPFHPTPKYRLNPSPPCQIDSETYYIHSRYLHYHEKSKILFIQYCNIGKQLSPQKWPHQRIVVDQLNTQDRTSQLVDSGAGKRLMTNCSHEHRHYTPSATGALPLHPSAAPAQLLSSPRFFIQSFLFEPIQLQIAANAIHHHELQYWSIGKRSSIERRHDTIQKEFQSHQSQILHLSQLPQELIEKRRQRHEQQIAGHKPIIPILERKQRLFHPSWW